MMAKKGNRYQNVKPFLGDKVNAPQFNGGRAREIGPASGVLEYTIKEGDRLDLLALNFYVDSRKWWRILDANPDVIFAADLSMEEYVGDIILIPRAIESGG